jgi:acetyltransferase-like isoleucine patch superfamily enzyme
MTPRSRIADLIRRGLGRGIDNHRARLERLVSEGVVSIGAHSYGVPIVHRYRGDTARASIGSFVSIAAEVELFVGGNHRADWISTYPFRVMFDLPGAFEDGHPASKGDIHIGHDVWLARGAKIMSGVEVGDGAVVAAHAVVTRPVRPYAIVGGNPAREIRRRFSDQEIEALLAIRWWSWPLDKILEAVPLLCSGSIAEFLTRYAREA